MMTTTIIIEHDAILTSIWETFLEENHVQSKQVLFRFSLFHHRSVNEKKKLYWCLSINLQKVFYLIILIVFLSQQLLIDKIVLEKQKINYVLFFQFNLFWINKKVLISLFNIRERERIENSLLILQRVNCCYKENTSHLHAYWKLSDYKLIFNNYKYLHFKDVFV